MTEPLRGVAASDESLVRELYPVLRRFAAAAAAWGVDPDDLLQEALVRALARGPLSSLDHPAAYLRRTMVNLSANHVRHGHVKERALAAVAASEPVDSRDMYPSDLTGLNELSPRARAILYLAEVEGYRYREIGRLMGCTAVAARMAAMRGRRVLRTHLDGGQQ